MPRTTNSENSMVNDIEWDAEPVPNLSQFDTYEEARDGFEWRIPDTYNVGTDVLTRHADDRGRVALFEETEDGDTEQHTFWQLERRSNELATALRNRGVERGDRIAVVSPQRVETALVHVAGYKLGAIVMPLSVLYGKDGLEFRLRDSGAETVFADPDALDAVTQATEQVDSVERVVGMDEEPSVESAETEVFADLRGSRQFEAVETAPDDPAVLIYTSGTTGEPKGVLQGHQYLLGHLPCLQMTLEFPWNEDVDPVWYTPADWAWVGGLYDVLLPAWHYGFPAVGYKSSGFDANETFRLLEDYGVTYPMLTPTMLKMMAQVDASGYDLDTVTAIATGGEPVPKELHKFVDETFGVSLNELYGQTEANLVAANNPHWFEPEPGSMGKPVPGHDVEIIDPESGSPADAGDAGPICVKRPDPVMFEEYWNSPELTADSFIGDWMDTDDLGYRDEDGRLWFKARDDDVIITSGYRVGPAEVEDALLEHEAVVDAAVIGVDDETRGKIVKAFVVPADGYEPSEDLRSDIQNRVRTDLAKYQYPRELTFLDELPTTTTGKIQRYKLRQEHEAE